MYKFLYLLLALSTFLANASENEALRVDRVVSNQLELAFENEKNVKAKTSAFHLDHYVTMSNELGERWAVLTLTNRSSGNRVLEKEHILATFADGNRRAPLDLKLHFKGNETQSITVAFGDSKFPILLITTEAES